MDFDMTTQLIKPLVISALSAALLACGGGTTDDSGGDTPSSWSQGVFAPSSQFKGQCSALNQKNWLRSWSNETYLWYDEIIDRDPASIASVEEYFHTLKTTATTASGAQKDKYHYVIPTDEWQQRQESGTVMGYGFNFELLRAAPPREVMVSYTEPGTPANAAGVRRGWEIIAVNGVDMINSNDIEALNSALYPETKGIQTEFTFKLVGSNEERKITLTAGNFVQDPVMNESIIATNDGNVGYLQFNSHNDPAERQLYDAFNYFASNNINDLVVDLRYNGGGLLAMAAQLGYMIAGTYNTDNLIFEKTVFNDKHPTINPVTGKPLTPYPFIDEYIGFDPASGISAGTKLPSLNLERVFILASPGTCSASEALINGLNGIPAARGFKVILIGGNTCGKPYGFYPTDNCDTTFFSIQFTGVNHAGFGDYADGFAPENTPNTTLAPEYVKGCAVPDDFTHLLGDKNEAMLAAALNYRASGVCPAPASAAGLKGYELQSTASEMGLSIGDNRWQTQLKNNRIVTPLPKEFN